MSYLIMAIAVYFLHLLLKLNMYATAAVALLLLIALPFHRRRNEQKKQQEERFFGVMNYMDTLLYAFLREQKAEAALRDVCLSLPDGRLKDVVTEAHSHMLRTFDDSDAVADGFLQIEQAYPCKRLKSIHAFILHVEAYGGRVEQTVLLLLSDKNAYEKRIRQAMEERKKSFREVAMSIGASLFICGMVLYIPIGNLDVSKNFLVQVLSVLVLVLDDLILLRAQTFLTADWLTVDAADVSVDYGEKIRAYSAYEEEKERRLSYLLAAATGGIAAVLFVFQKSWAALLMLMLFSVCLNQHRIGHFLAGRAIKRNIQIEFPNWLTDLVLLLQSENVQVALAKSREHVPPVLREALEELIAHLELSPEASEPYHEFLKEFALPEVTSAMSMLYALSIGNSGHAERQMTELIEKNQMMLETAEAARLKDKNSGMYLLFLAPVVTASLKLVTDMAIFMLSFLSSAVI